MSPDSRWVSLNANSGPPDLLLTGVRYIHFESWVPGTIWEGQSGAENQALPLEMVLVKYPPGSWEFRCPTRMQSPHCDHLHSLSQGLGRSPCALLTPQAFLRRRGSSGNSPDMPSTSLDLLPFTGEEIEAQGNDITWPKSLYTIVLFHSLAV